MEEAKKNERFKRKTLCYLFPTLAKMAMENTDDYKSKKVKRSYEKIFQVNEECM